MARLKDFIGRHSRQLPSLAAALLEPCQRQIGIEHIEQHAASSQCTAQHGIVADASALMLLMRTMPEVHEWRSEDYAADRWALHMDYAYGLSFNDWIVNFDCAA